MTTSAMSPLQQRMLEDMQLRGLSARTHARPFHLLFGLRKESFNVYTQDA